MNEQTPQLNHTELSKKGPIASFFMFFWEIFKVVVTALAIIIPLRYFLVQPFVVNGSSMEPTYSNGEYLIVDQLSYRLNDPERGDVIVFRYPENPSQFFIKRIVGLPGEVVEVDNGEVVIYNDQHQDGVTVDESEYLYETTPGNTRTELSEDEFFVMGDNRDESLDSRSWGALPRDLIIGRSWIRAFPVEEFTKFEHENYIGL